MSTAKKDSRSERVLLTSDVPRSIAEAQLLNIPASVFACILCIVFGIFADTGIIPQPLIPLAFMVVIEACYAVLYAYPNTGGVYAATIIAGGFSTAW